MQEQCIQAHKTLPGAAMHHLESQPILTWCAVQFHHHLRRTCFHKFPPHDTSTLRSNTRLVEVLTGPVASSVHCASPPSTDVHTTPSTQHTDGATIADDAKSTRESDRFEARCIVLGRVDTSVFSHVSKYGLTYSFFVLFRTNNSHLCLSGLISIAQCDTITRRGSRRVQHAQ